MRCLSFHGMYLLRESSGDSGMYLLHENSGYSGIIYCVKTPVILE